MKVWNVPKVDMRKCSSIFQIFKKYLTQLSLDVLRMANHIATFKTSFVIHSVLLENLRFLRKQWRNLALQDAHLIESVCFDNNPLCVCSPHPPHVSWKSHCIQINDSIVAKTTITVPGNGCAVEAVSTIEAVPYGTRSRKKSGEKFLITNFTCGNCEFKYSLLLQITFISSISCDFIVLTVAPSWAESTSIELSETNSEAPSTPLSDFPPHLQTPRLKRGEEKQHIFVPKTVRSYSNFVSTKLLALVPYNQYYCLWIVLCYTYYYSWQAR